MFTAPTMEPELSWDWVEGQLRDADMYWVAPTGGAHPHPRPVWGVWSGRRPAPSVGSPVVQRLLTADPRVTVHLDSSLDVVIVEGVVTGPTTDERLVAAYDAKYDWHYDVDQYGPFTTIAPAAGARLAGGRCGRT